MKKYLIFIMLNFVFATASFASVFDVVPTCPTVFPGYSLSEVSGPFKLGYYAVSSGADSKKMVTVYVHANGAAGAMAAANQIIESGLTPVWNKAHLYEQHNATDSYYCAYTSNTYVLSDQSPLVQRSSPFAAADYLITINKK